MPLANFIASGLLRLGTHLGPILWQFPPNFRFDPARIEAFLRLLPHDTEAAAKLGAKHDGKLHAVPPGSRWPSKRPIRHAFEIRHESFRCDAFIELLRAHNVGPGLRRLRRMAAADGRHRRLRLLPVARVGGSYMRVGYDNAALEDWARARPRLGERRRTGRRRTHRRQGQPAQRDVFVFFDNDRKVRAPANALELMRRLRT